MKLVTALISVRSLKKCKWQFTCIFSITGVTSGRPSININNTANFKFYLIKCSFWWIISWNHSPHQTYSFFQALNAMMSTLFLKFWSHHYGMSTEVCLYYWSFNTHLFSTNALIAAENGGKQLHLHLLLLWQDTVIPYLHTHPRHHFVSLSCNVDSCLHS